MEGLYKLFDDYVSHYDKDNDMIKNKYEHTYRVVSYAKKIAESENLNNHDTKLALTCALLHDIARFKQATEYNTFHDKLSFDHGDEGYNILKENDYINKYIDNDEDKNIVLKAVKNHNKLNIEDGLTERELYFSKLTRDSDKLDIFVTQINEIKDNSNAIDERLLDSIKTRTQAQDKYITNDCGLLFRMICFIYDLNFKESFKILLSSNLLDKKFELLKTVNNIDTNKIKNEIYSYIEERID